MNSYKATPATYIISGLSVMIAGAILGLVGWASFLSVELGELAGLVIFFVGLIIARMEGHVASIHQEFARIHERLDQTNGKIDKL